MSKTIKFKADFKSDEGEEVVFEFENELKKLTPISIEEAVARILCFSNPENICECKTSLSCEKHEKYKTSALAAIVVVLNAEGFSKTRNVWIDKKELN